MQSIYENIPGLDITIVDELRRNIKRGYEFSIRTQIDKDDKPLGYLVEIDIMHANHGFSISKEHFECLKNEHGVIEDPRLPKL